jgi:hypothetical protein
MTPPPITESCSESGGSENKENDSGIAPSSGSSTTSPRSLLREELSRVRSELKSANSKMEYYKRKSVLSDEISPRMMQKKLEDIFGENNAVTSIILSQIKRYEHNNSGVPQYSPYERALSLTIYYSCGRKGYE